MTREDLAGIRIGVPVRHFYHDLDTSVMKGAMETIQRLERAGFTLVETDAIEQIEMLHHDTVKTVVSYEVPRAIQDYLEAHNFPKTFEYVIGKVASPDSRQILKRMT